MTTASSSGSYCKLELNCDILKIKASDHSLLFIMLTDYLIHVRYFTGCKKYEEMDLFVK